MTNGIFSSSFFAQSSAVNSQVLAPASYTPSSASVFTTSMTSVFSSSQSSSSFSSSSRTDLFAQSCFASLTLAFQSSSFGSSSSSSSQNSAASRKYIIAKRQHTIEKFEKSLEGYTELIKAADAMNNPVLKFQALKDRYITYFEYARALSDTAENFKKRCDLLTQAIIDAEECEKLSQELGPISDSSFSYYHEMPRIRFDQGKILLMLGDDLQAAESAFEEALHFYEHLQNDDMIGECKQRLKELTEKRDSSDIVEKALEKPLNGMDLRDH